MAPPLAYHVVVHALEGRAQWTASTRFAAIVDHVNNGHLPYERHHRAGNRRATLGATEGQIESAVLEHLSLDATAGVRVMMSLATPSVVVDGFNAYNASAKIAVKTSVSITTGGGPNTLVLARRETLLGVPDPTPCRAGTLALFHGLLSSVERNAKSGVARARPSLSECAAMVGAHGAAADAAAVFEAAGAMTIAQLARELGCHQRSLERKLRREGLTAEALRQAVRLIRATDRLSSSDSLTTIAIDEGFSDLAHMTRAFQTAAGLPPSALRALHIADRNASDALRGLNGSVS